ncbi:MAG: hypothetical protein ABSB63_15935 [Spirochaetia bacterium]
MTAAQIRQHVKKIERRIGLNQPPFPEILLVSTDGQSEHFEDQELIVGEADSVLSPEGDWLPAAIVGHARVLIGFPRGSFDLAAADNVMICRGNESPVAESDKRQNMSGEG